MQISFFCKMLSLAAVLVLVGCDSEPEGPSIEEVLAKDGKEIATQIASLEAITKRKDPLKAVKLDGPPMVVSGIMWGKKEDKPNATWIYADDLALKPAKAHHKERIAGATYLSNCLYALKKKTFAPNTGKRAGKPVSGAAARNHIKRCKEVVYAIVIDSKSFETATGVDRNRGTFKGGASSNGEVRIYNLRTNKYLGGFQYFAAPSVTMGNESAMRQEILRRLEEKLKSNVPGVKIII